MNRNRALPLGIDIGSTRVRVAAAVKTSTKVQLQGIAVREVPSGVLSGGTITEPHFIAAILEDAVRELRTKERRCVCALGEPEALLRRVTLPKMTSSERERAARFEAERHVDFPIQEAVVRIHPADRIGRSWALGIAKGTALRSRLAALKRAGLFPLGIDHDGSALARALPHFDAAIDIGYQRSALHVFGSTVPSCFPVFTGGANITAAIARELALDETTAEDRKRVHGTSGAGERARAALCAELCGLVEQARRAVEIRRIALVGNGSRLAGLVSDLEAATGVFFELAVCDALRDSNYAQDVVTVGAPDWTMAAALTAWNMP